MLDPEYEHLTDNALYDYRIFATDEEVAQFLGGVLQPLGATLELRLGEPSSVSDLHEGETTLFHRQMVVTVPIPDSALDVVWACDILAALLMNVRNSPDEADTELTDEHIIFTLTWYDNDGPAFEQAAADRTAAVAHLERHHPVSLNPNLVNLMGLDEQQLALLRELNTSTEEVEQP